MEYVRKYLQEVIDRINEDRDKIQVLVGPRQVGKSTLIKQVVKKIDIPYHFVSADESIFVNANWLTEAWQKSRFELKIKNQKEHLLIIDEIQKIDNWSQYVKKLWDEDTFNDTNLKVILLGSSRVLIKKGLTESLAGRYELIRMPYWTFDEMRDAFDFSLQQYIYFGGYPGAAKYIKNETRWKNYIKDSLIDSAINKDILETATVNKPALLKQLFEIACSYSGQLLSLNKILGQLSDAGNVTTLSNYLSLLEEGKMLAGLQKFANDNARKYNSVPKFQVYNNALLNAYNNSNFKKESLDYKAWGRQVESCVGTHLVNMSDIVGYKTYYWREKDDEVDFVIVKNGRTVGIEVKSGRRTTNNGLSLFRNKFNPYAAFVVGSGGISIEEFLQMDLNVLFES